MLFEFTFNRTSLELKLIISMTEYAHSVSSFNRTSLELKLALVGYHFIKGF